MPAVTVRNLIIGEGTPKICVPLVDFSIDSLIRSAENAVLSGADLVEWRVDCFLDQSIVSVLKVLNCLRNVLQTVPLLFTFRTIKEGGKREISAEEYQALLSQAIASKTIDLVDIELFMGDPIVSALVSEAHRHQVKTILSNHDFHQTPPKDVLLSRLKKMQRLGADIPKIAVMPQCAKDVLTLLSATEEMSRCFAEVPIITMAMSKLGVISRIFGETFGSAVTFASLGNSSAPGQIEISDLRRIWSVLK